MGMGFDGVLFAATLTSMATEPVPKIGVSGLTGSLSRAGWLHAKIPQGSRAPIWEKKGRGTPSR